MIFVILAQQLEKVLSGCLLDNTNADFEHSFLFAMAKTSFFFLVMIRLNLLDNIHFDKSTHLADVQQSS